MKSPPVDLLNGYACPLCWATVAGPIGARYHVGDTPMDIQAAQASGAIAIGVATGIFSKEVLLASAGPGAIILDNLTDLPAVMAALGLRS